MAELPKDPAGADLEDWVSARFASRGCYVETTIKERNPDEILELDVVWTDYRKDPEQRSRARGVLAMSSNFTAGLVTYS